MNETSHTSGVHVCLYTDIILMFCADYYEQWLNLIWKRLFACINLGLGIKGSLSKFVLKVIFGTFIIYETFNTLFIKNSTDH